MGTLEPMSARCALLVDSDERFSDMLRGALSACGLEVVVSTEWSDALVTAVDPRIVFIAVDLPDKAGFALCGRVKALSPAVPIVLATATVPQDELDSHQRTESGADAYLDKRTLSPEELIARVDALVGREPTHGFPVPAGVDPEAGRELGEGQDEPEVQLVGRVAELEEEVGRLRWELDETRLAAQGAPSSGNFLRLSAVVGSKEKEVVRLKKEIWAREHKIATGQRTVREASARALIAIREREAAFGHAAQLQKDLEAEQAEVRRLRLEVQHRAAEAEQAVASLIGEAQQHEATLVAHAEALKQAKQEQLEARSALEARLREDKERALAAVSAKWRRRLKALRRGRAHSLAILHDQLRDLRTAQLQELAAARAGAESQRLELERLHQLSLAEALAGHADAEQRAEQHRSSRIAAEARLREEKAQAVAAAAAEAEMKLDELRRAHADSVGALRRHFQGQLSGYQAAQERERATRDGGQETALRRAAEDLAAARLQAAELDHETRQGYELELVQVQTRHLEALAALETRLREEKDQALAASGAEWVGKLDELRREHVASVDALRRQHLDRLGALQASGAQELAKRDGEHEAALRRTTEELAAARTQASQLDQETGQRHELELARVQAGLLEALTALETRLRQEKDQAIAATVAVWEGKLEELRRGHAASVATLRREYQDRIASLQASREQGAAAAQVDAERQREELRRLHELALAEVLAAQVDAERRAEQDHREERTDAVAAAVAGWEGKLDELRRGHAGSLDDLRRQHLDQVAALQASGAQELAQRDREHQAAFNSAAEELAAARTEAAQLDQETRQRYELEFIRAESRHLEASRLLEARLREQKDQAVAAAVTTWEGNLEELRSGHAQAVDALSREHQDQLAALLAAREQERAQQDDEHEAALRRVGEELAAVRAKAAPPGPAQVQARHAEALKALEARLREEKDQAVAAAAAEWKAKMERLRRGHADAVAALRREHQDLLGALEAAQQKLAKPRPLPEQSDKVVPLKAVTSDRSR